MNKKIFDIGFELKLKLVGALIAVIALSIMYLSHELQYDGIDHYGIFLKKIPSNIDCLYVQKNRAGRSKFIKITDRESIYKISRILKNEVLNNKRKGLYEINLIINLVMNNGDDIYLQVLKDKDRKYTHIYVKSDDIEGIDGEIVPSKDEYGIINEMADKLKSIHD